jgi:putative phosphoesterase
MVKNMTKIGILSDTHDNQISLQEALILFKKKSVELVFHAGDFIAPFSVKKLFDFPLRCVFGNNDGEKNVIRRLMSQQETCILEEILLIEQIDGKQIAMTHGHHQSVLKSILDSGNNDIVISGHTHEKKIESLPNGTIWINPGEAGGWLKGSASVAILDLNSMRSEFYEVWKY